MIFIVVTLVFPTIESLGSDEITSNLIENSYLMQRERRLYESTRLRGLLRNLYEQMQSKQKLKKPKLDSQQIGGNIFRYG
jgi:hypothetical protein